MRRIRSRESGRRAARARRRRPSDPARRTGPLGGSGPQPSFRSRCGGTGWSSHRRGPPHRRRIQVCWRTRDAVRRRCRPVPRWTKTPALPEERPVRTQIRLEQMGRGRAFVERAPEEQQPELHWLFDVVGAPGWGYCPASGSIHYPVTLYTEGRIEASETSVVESVQAAGCPTPAEFVADLNSAVSTTSYPAVAPAPPGASGPPADGSRP
jgi:hypothetical protein